MWLARLLTVTGYSVCTHEACEFAGSPEEFWANAEHYCNGLEVYGNSDSANIFVLPAVLAERPLTRVVWINRSITEVARSMKRARMPVSERSLQTLMMMRDRHREHFDLIVDFEDLEDEQACEAVWEFCLDRPFDRERWQSLRRLKICYNAQNPFPVKAYAKFLSWAQHEVDQWTHGGEISR